jgi:hypothetical protein
MKFFSPKRSQDNKIADTSGHANNVVSPMTLFQPADAGVPPTLQQFPLPACKYLALDPAAMCVPLAPRISENKMAELTRHGHHFIRETMRTDLQHY